MNLEEAASRCWLEVDLDALRRNYRSAVALMDGGAVIPVLKANAYGMGAVEVAQALKAEGARLFAVATADEAMQLLACVNGVEVLCLGLVGPESMARLIAQDMPLTLYSPAQGAQIARVAEALGRVARVHVKVDTGLHRLGLEPDTAAETVAALCAGGRIQPVGLYTHLAIHSPESDQLQVEKLMRVRAELAARSICIPLCHAVDSIGMARYAHLHLDAARTGAWLYGVSPRNAPVPCEGVACFRARVSQLRWVRKGELIGYDDDSPLTRDTHVATVSAGYVDGTPRRGNNWQVELRGMRASVLGVACMVQLMIDATDVPEVQEGDVVTFVGGNIGVEEYARMGALNHNEAWARIGRRVPRIYFENGSPVRARAELESEISL